MNSCGELVTAAAGGAPASGTTEHLYTVNLPPPTRPPSQPPAQDPPSCPPDQLLDRLVGAALGWQREVPGRVAPLRHRGAGGCSRRAGRVVGTRMDSACQGGRG
jgi:hypothetical protein